MIASPFQDLLRETLAIEAQKAKPDALKGVRIYVVVDNEHLDGARKALAHTGANVLQIDLDSKIPQRSERLELYQHPLNGEEE